MHLRTSRHPPLQSSKNFTIYQLVPQNLLVRKLELGNDFLFIYPLVENLWIPFSIMNLKKLANCTR
jgi:hypothetical protein